MTTCLNLARDDFNVISGDCFSTFFLLSKFKNDSVSITYDTEPTIEFDGEKYLPKFGCIIGQFYADNQTEGEKEMLRIFKSNESKASFSRRHWFGSTEYDSCLVKVPSSTFRFINNQIVELHQLGDKYDHQVTFIDTVSVDEDNVIMHYMDTVLNKEHIPIGTYYKEVPGIRINVDKYKILNY